MPAQIIVLDASAVVAILCQEEDHLSLMAKIDLIEWSGDVRKISAISVWETACAVSRIFNVKRSQALRDVEEFLHAGRIDLVPADHEITRLAIEAAERYGYGQAQPGILNLGDCYSYATARYFSAPLLCKGNDFVRTDIELA